MNKLALLHFSWEYKDQLLPTFLYLYTQNTFFIRVWFCSNYVEICNNLLSLRLSAGGFCRFHQLNLFFFVLLLSLIWSVLKS